MAACFDTTHGDKGRESGRKRRTCSVTPGRATQGKKEGISAPLRQHILSEKAPVDRRNFPCEEVILSVKTHSCSAFLAAA